MRHHVIVAAWWSIGNMIVVRIGPAVGNGSFIRILPILPGGYHPRLHGISDAWGARRDARAHAAVARRGMEWLASQSRCARPVSEALIGSLIASGTPAIQKLRAS